MSGFLSATELDELGLHRFGGDVFIDRSARIIRPDRLEIGSNVRIDAYSVISCGVGGISIGDYVHIGAFAFMAGGGRIELHDFSGLSGRVSIYSSNEDYSGASLTNPTVPDDYRTCEAAPVTLERHVIVGAGSIVLPGVTIGEGAAVGSLSLVKRNIEPFAIFAGGRTVKARKRDVLELEKQLRSRVGGS